MSVQCIFISKSGKISGIYENRLSNLKLIKMLKICFPIFIFQMWIGSLPHY